MKRILALTLLLVAPLGHSGAATEPGTVLVFGGDISCATWLQNDQFGGHMFILGYWTGRNTEGVKGVGHTTDGNGVAGEVQLVCQAQPSLSLLNAVSQVYKRFSDEGR